MVSRPSTEAQQAAAAARRSTASSAGAPERTCPPGHVLSFIRGSAAATAAAGDRGPGRRDVDRRRAAVLVARLDPDVADGERAHAVAHVDLGAHVGDHRHRADVVDLLRRLWEEGTTIAVITHDREVAAALPRCVAMRDGRIESDLVTAPPEVGAGSGIAGRPEAAR